MHQEHPYGGEVHASDKPSEMVGPNPHVDEHARKPRNGDPAPERGTDRAPATNGTEVLGSEQSPAGGRWHSAAGRKGALRLRQLIEEGLLYEKEHGLRRGRQRIRQLVEEGKLYEKEHGLGPVARRRVRLPRADKRELLHALLDTLARLADRKLRPEIVRLAGLLEKEESGR